MVVPGGQVAVAFSPLGAVPGLRRANVAALSVNNVAFLLHTAGGRALMGTLMNILLEEQDKMLRSFQAQLGEKTEAGADAR